MSSIPGFNTNRLGAAIVHSAVMLTLCLVATASGSAIADESSLESRIQKTEDELQIRNVMVEYGQYLDTLNFVAYSQLFARDGEWSGQLSGHTTIKGPEKIRAAMEKAFADRTYDPDRVTNLHLISNIRIAVEGDRATGYSRWTVLSRNGNDEPYIRLSGRYDDIFVREDGRWKFLSRSARREIP